MPRASEHAIATLRDFPQWPAIMAPTLGDAAGENAASWAWEVATLVANTLFSVLFVFGQVVGYIPQYLDIRNGKGEGFSSLVSLVLLAANTLRIFFWIGKQFDVILLYQSVVMIVTQIVLLEACAARLRGELALTERPSRFWDCRPHAFWRWHDLLSYVQAVLAFSAAMAALCFFLLQYAWFVEGLGALALAIEACLGLPQLYRNQVSHSTQGLSSFLIGSWLLGDVGKTIIFVALAAPLQFLACGLFQIVIDIVIIAQMISFRQRPQQTLSKLVDSITGSFTNMPDPIKLSHTLTVV